MKKDFLVKIMKSRLGVYLVEMRVWQWTKNLLVFTPLIFSLSADNIALLEKATAIFVAFCLAASAVYVANDLFDIEADRAHPKKKHRPLANGAISTNSAMFLIILLLGGSLVFSGFVSEGALGLIAIYVATNFLYSKKLKHIPVLDIVLVSMFYVLRIYAGGIAVGVPISSWLLLTASFASLFLIIGKRRAELVHVQKDLSNSRKVLNEYNAQFLDFSLMISLTLSIIFYSLYSINEHDRLFSLSILVIVYGSLRYLYLVYVKNLGEEPEKMLFLDRPLFLTGVVFVLFIMFALYLDLAKF